MTESDEQEKSNSPSLSKRILSNPTLNGWGFIVGVVGLIFALYQIWDSQRAPFVTAQVHSIRTILVSTEGVQNLKIYADNKPIQGPVTAVQIALWNAGKAPVKSEDILDPIRITANSKSPILSARIIRKTRDIIGFTLDDTKAAEGVLTASFRVLEAGDGALIQVTYLGDDSVKFVGSGAIIGQQAVSILKSTDQTGDRKTGQDKLLSKSTAAKFVLALTLLFGCYLFIVGKWVLMRARKGLLLTRRKFSLVVLTMVLLFATIGIGIMATSVWDIALQPSPPFDFQ